MSLRMRAVLVGAMLALAVAPAAEAAKSSSAAANKGGSAKAKAKKANHKKKSDAGKTSRTLRKEISSRRMFKHLEAFQDIANNSGGHRASGFEGYGASVQYVLTQLRAAGYNPTTQVFDFVTFQEVADPLVREVSPTAKTYTATGDAPEVITMDDPATAAIRRKRNSSIRIAADCVRDGRAAGLVSAGHTGAGMVVAKMVIGTIEGVDRPALATVLPNLDPVHKISIVARGFGALGFTMQLPLEDRYLMTRSDLQSQLSVLLGGRTAEEISLGEISTGAQNDLQRATDIARAMVTEWGMSDTLGAVNYDGSRDRPMFLNAPSGHDRGPYAEHTAQQIDGSRRIVLPQLDCSPDGGNEVMLHERVLGPFCANLVCESTGFRCLS